MTTYRLVFSSRTLTEANLLEAPKYNLCINAENDFCLGNAASAEVSFKTKELTSSSIGQSFTLYIDEHLSASSERNLGYFTIKEATKDKNGVFSIKAYDNMVKFDIDVADWLSTLSENITLSAFISSLGNKCGVSVNTTSLPNSTMTVPKIAISQITGRQILKYVCQATGRYAYINDRTLYFDKFTSVNTSFDSSQYVSIDLNDFTTPAITGLWIGQEDGDVGVFVGTNTNVYKIYANPILFKEDLTTVANTILNQITSFTYTPGTIDLRYLYDLKAGQIITVNNKSFAIMEIQYSVKGCTIVSKGLPERSQIQSTTDAISSMLGKTNVFKRTLDATVSEITDLDGRVSNVTQTVNGLTSSVYNLDGRVSTLSQTVDGMRSTVEDVDGRMSVVEQTVDGLETEVSDLDGNVSTLSQTVDGMQSTVSALDGRVTQVVQDIDGLSVTVAGPSAANVTNVSYETPSPSSGTFRGFTNVDGWYVAGNAGINSSYGICRVNFTTTVNNVTLPIHIYERGETAYDYGYMSYLDSPLSHNYVNPSSDYKYEDWKGSGSGDPSETITDTIYFSVPTAGSHFVEFKYYKDSNTSPVDEVFKFKIDFPTSMHSTLTIDKGSAGITSTNINFNGLVTFSNLSGNDGTTVINGSNITTGSISADRIYGGTISGSEINLSSGDASFSIDSNGRMFSTGGNISTNSMSFGANGIYIDNANISGVQNIDTSSLDVSTLRLGQNVIVPSVTAIQQRYFVVEWAGQSATSVSFVMRCFTGYGGNLTTTPETYSFNAVLVIAAKRGTAWVQGSRQEFQRTFTINAGQTQSSTITVYYTPPVGSTTAFVADQSKTTSFKTFTSGVDGLCTGCSVIPRLNATYDLGHSSYKWNDIYAANGTIQTSDKENKTDIEPLSDEYSDLFDKLKPVTFKFKDGHRTHTGLIAQDVEDALEECKINSEDFACFVKSTDDDGNSSYGLRYTEIIALLIKEVQSLKEEVKILKDGNMN